MNQHKKLALWVPAESKSRFFSSAQSLEPLIHKIKQYNITDVFLQVFRQGRTFFKSDIFDSEAESEILENLLTFLKKESITAHAWLNVCNLGLKPSDRFISLLGGSDAKLKNSFNNETLDLTQNFQIDTPGCWLEPSNPLLKSAINSLLSELDAFSFDGIHLDFIRYPYAIPIRPASWINLGLDYGYSALALERFLAGRSEAGCFRREAGQLLLVSEPKALEFDSWRRNQISQLVQSVRANLSSNKCKLSVAALAWSDRAYLNAYQDWRSWLSDGLIDSLALMTYTADTQLLSQQAKQAAAFLSSNQELFIGIGLYKLDSEVQLKNQINAINQLGFIPSIFCAEALLSF